MSSDSRLAESLRADKFALEQAAGMRNGGHGLSSLVVNDLDLVSVAFAKLETDAPALIDRHRPLAFAVAFQLVQPDASQWAQVVQRFRRIERQQQIDHVLEVEPAQTGSAARRPKPCGSRNSATTGSGHKHTTLYGEAQELGT